MVHTGKVMRDMRDVWIVSTFDVTDQRRSEQGRFATLAEAQAFMARMVTTQAMSYLRKGEKDRAMEQLSMLSDFLHEHLWKDDCDAYGFIPHENCSYRIYHVYDFDAPEAARG